MSCTLDYTIIVPAFNEERQLARTLPAMRSAMSGVEARGELIVVDNNSTDETARVAADHGAKVVFEPINMISRARNAGARAASGSVLIFIDADTTPSAGLLIAALEAVAQPGCVGGGAVVRLDPPPSWLTRRLASCWNLVSRMMGYPAGCFFYCRGDAFESVGGFSEALYASEEIWLARRLRKCGASRPTRMGLRVLTEPIVTSSRKMDNGPRMYGMLLLMFVFPFAVRFKALCGYWYRRQDSVDRV